LRAPREPKNVRYWESGSGLGSREEGDHGDPTPTPTETQACSATLSLRRRPKRVCGHHMNLRVQGTGSRFQGGQRVRLTLNPNQGGGDHDNPTPAPANPSSQHNFALRCGSKECSRVSVGLRQGGSGSGLGVRGGGGIMTTLPPPLQPQACSASSSLRCGSKTCSRAPREPAGTKRGGSEGSGSIPMMTLLPPPQKPKLAARLCLYVAGQTRVSGYHV